MTNRLALVLAMVVVFALGCGGSADKPLVSVPYTPATGATAEVPGRVKVIVPPGAAAANGTLEIYPSKITTMPLATAQAVDGFRIELTGQPEGARLAAPARIIFPLAGGRLTGAVDGGLDGAGGVAVDGGLDGAWGTGIDANIANIGGDASAGVDAGVSVDGGAVGAATVSTEDKYFIAYYQSDLGRWLEEPAIVDLQAQTVEVRPLHFSDWWLYILGPGKAVATTTNFKIWFDPTTNIRALGTNDNYQAAVRIGQQLEVARAAYLAAGFKPFTGRLTVNIDAAADVSQYRWLWKDLVISGQVYGTDNDLLQEIAHEFFHACQANEWGALTMARQRWFVEAAADWAADKIVFKTGVVGGKVSTQENMKTDYLVKAATTVDDHHEYATANFINFFVGKGLSFRDAHVAIMFGGTSALGAAIKAKSSLAGLDDAWLKYTAWLAVDPASPYRLLGVTVFDNIPLAGARGLSGDETSAPTVVSARVDPGSLTAGIVAIKAGATMPTATIHVDGPTGLTLAYLLPGGDVTGATALGTETTRSLSEGDVMLALATSADASKVTLRVGPQTPDAATPNSASDAARDASATSRADADGSTTKKHGRCTAHLCSAWNPDYSAFWDSQRTKSCTADSDCAGIPPLYTGMAQGPALCSSSGDCLGCDSDADCADLVNGCRDAVTCTAP